MLKTTEGQRVPQVTFTTRRGHEWRPLTAAEIFTGRSVIVFSLPGAFTPTCSSSHVPRYNQLQPLFKARGIDEIRSALASALADVPELHAYERPDFVIPTDAVGAIRDALQGNFGGLPEPDVAELARDYSDADSLRSDPDIARFIAWVRGKPPDYVDWPKAPRRRRRSSR